MTRETYPAMLAAGAALYGFPFAGFWRVIDTPDDRDRAAHDLGTTQLDYLSRGEGPARESS